MAKGLNSFLHMDGEWMWRFYFLDDVEKVIAVSALAYFTRHEAECAMRMLQSGLVMSA